MLSTQNPAMYGPGMKMDVRLGDVTAQAKCDQNKRRQERMRTVQNPQIPWQMNKDHAAHRHRFVARQMRLIAPCRRAAQMSAPSLNAEWPKETRHRTAPCYNKALTDLRYLNAEPRNSKHDTCAKRSSLPADVCDVRGVFSPKLRDADSYSSSSRIRGDDRGTARGNFSNQTCRQRQTSRR